MNVASNSLALFIAILAAGSLATWVWLSIRRTGSADFLPYEPRKRVPWNGGFGLFAMVPVLAILLASSAPQRPVDMTEQPTLSSQQYVEAAWSGVVFNLSLVLIVSVWLVKGLAANWSDLGLPARKWQWAQDVRLGILTALAALAPIYGVQTLLVQVTGWEAYHPTLDQIFTQPGWQVIVASYAAAVIAAPIGEEFMFRLLFQGWLEKVEDVFLDWKPTERNLSSDNQTGVSDVPPAATSPAAHSDADPGAANPYASPATTSPTIEAADQTGQSQASIDHQARRSLVSLSGLPHGWAPILASSFMFGIAHWGQGPAPVSLFLFGIILGYVYQRTHRVVPCIVAHMVFNAVSLTAACVWGSSG